MSYIILVSKREKCRVRERSRAPAAGPFGDHRLPGREASGRDFGRCASVVALRAPLFRGLVSPSSACKRLLLCWAPGPRSRCSGRETAPFYSQLDPASALGQCTGDFSFSRRHPRLLWASLAVACLLPVGRSRSALREVEAVRVVRFGVAFGKSGPH